MNKDERSAQAFYDELEGGRLGLLSIVARVVFDLSGYFYAGSLVRKANLRPTDRLLEVGCGTASILIRAHGFRDSGSTYCGVDISSVMLDRARHNIRCHGLDGSIFIASVPASSLPFKDESFSVALFAFAIKHLSDDTLMSALGEAHRVLVPGGRLVMWEFLPLTVFKRWAERYVYSVTRAVRLRDLKQVTSFLEKNSFSRPEPFTIVAPWMPTGTFALVATKDE
ncbi:MAG: class I SAM-dependent methyltransferase [Planctomycetota bacterium]|jgi:ubiquinone/menaquinone biosynthesis C-methylase UbiE